MKSKKKTEAPIFYIMGVSGSGKTTIGKLLSEALSIPFFDGDNYHSTTNIEKMASGIPLDDNDRLGWLLTLNTLAKDNRDRGAIIACSALKKNYRDLLGKEIEENVVWVYLKGTFDEISERLRKRSGHFMPPALLKSQFDTLEDPIDAISISIKNEPGDIVSEIIEIYQGNGLT